MISVFTDSSANAPRRQPLGLLLRRAEKVATPESFQPDFADPIDRSKFFVCPSLTPLYYTRLYGELNPAQQLRYNQLCGMGFNELIAFFEGSFASSVIAALADAKLDQSDSDWSKCLRQFLDDEAKHICWWNLLNRLSDPSLYRDTDSVIIRFSPLLRRLLKTLTSHPRRLTAVFWVMLALEERSLEISRRVLKMDRDFMEPRYRLIYKQHIKDESRHVQIDWHLIERFYSKSGQRSQNFNARLLAFMMGEFFLKPNRSAVRVVSQLVAEHTELSTRLPEMIRQLKSLHHNPDYHFMMYSRETTPILFSLFDRHPAMQRMKKTLLAYEPQKYGGT